MQVLSEDALDHHNSCVYIEGVAESHILLRETTLVAIVDLVYIYRDANDISVSSILQDTTVYGNNSKKSGLSHTVTS